MVSSRSAAGVEQARLRSRRAHQHRRAQRPAAAGHHASATWPGPRYDTLLAQLRLKAAAGTLGEEDVQAINDLLQK
ncbi:MAG: hypothetical protein MZW92_58215 [Comamonadaceae bacterium]|nr:hypothetical protein [Comamonadaceae bacterium]